MQGIAEQQLKGIEVKSLPRAYTDLAWARHQSGEINDSLWSIQEAITQIEHDADSFYVWFRAGQIYETAGLTRQAILAYQICLEKRPYHTIARDAIERLSNTIQE